jgi:HK97 family phage prohead protease
MLALTEPIRPGASIAPDGTVEGYASLFGEIDQARDMVMPGAFERSLKLRGVRRIPMLFQHDPAEPVGVWLELREDHHGLYARGRLIPEVARGRELLALLRAGTADGLSIGFRTVKGRLDPKTRVRKLDVIDLWEISIVTFPLLPGARLALASKASGQREHLQVAAPGPRAASLRSAARLRSVKQASSPPLLPARTSPLPIPPPLAGEGRVGVAREWTRREAPPDPALARFKPERLYRRQARFRFGAGAERMNWRDLILSERALRQGRQY